MSLKWVETWVYYFSHLIEESKLCAIGSLEDR